MAAAWLGVRASEPRAMSHFGVWRKTELVYGCARASLGCCSLLALLALLPAVC